MVMRAMRKIHVLPSILASDFSQLGIEIQAAMKAGGDLVHIDIMDGHFVPNITFGPDIVKAIRPVTPAPFDVHLMISPVDPYLEAFSQAGADILTVHAEAGPHLHRSVQAIRAMGKKAGVAINPGTPENVLGPVLDCVDLVLVMTVNPGFGGQAFLLGMLDKVRAVRHMIGDRDIVIEVDGGVTAANAGACAAAGADFLVAGSSVFKDGPALYARNIAAIREAAEAAVGLRT